MNTLHDGTDQRNLATNVPLQTLETIAFLYPVLLLVAFYGTWFSAWFVLGHPPRASLDDPKETLGAIYLASGIIILLEPLGVFAAVISMARRFVYSSYSKRSGIIFAVLNVMLWVGVLLLLRSDPNGVVYWWCD